MFLKAQIFKGLNVYLNMFACGAFVAFASRCFGAILALVSQVVFVCMLGVGDAGRYILSASCVLFVSVGQIGLGLFLVRFAGV